jgi:DNA-binding HxlR family transcriptional regulator
MQKSRFDAMPCPVARTLDVIGEWWTLMIVRDAFRGARRFEEFRSVGIADNILSTRLRKLVEQGVFERLKYSDRPVRFEYVLTEKGRDLLSVVAALASWGRKWTAGPDTTGIRHDVCGEPLRLQIYCDKCERTVEPSEIRVPRAIRPVLSAAS